jgi:hypothetical protein
MPTDEKASKYRDGTNCAIHWHERKLVEPSGREVFYPLDMWPPKPGQECRPHVLNGVVEVDLADVSPSSLSPLSGGSMGIFFPAGLLSLSGQRLENNDVRKVFRGHNPGPMVAPFAEQLDQWR